MSRALSKSAASPSTRTFLAIELPDDIRAKLTSIERHLLPHQSLLKIVSPELLHITLRFLGSVPEEKLQAVKTAAASASRRVDPFSLTLASVDSFPELRAPRVVWVGLRNDSGYEDLQRLFQRLEERLIAEGFESEGRSFAPHITVARVREGTPAAATPPLQETLERLKASPDFRGSFRVNRLTVMRSDLSPRGPKYTPLAHAALGQTT